MSEVPFIQRVAAIRDRISTASKRAGTVGDVTLVAVTKGHPADAVQDALNEGLHDIGENRVDEALAKQELVQSDELSWHFIGNLQRRKARDVVGRFSLIHSVDRIELAEAISKRTGAAQQAILVQVNCSQELQKGGVEPAKLEEVMTKLAGLTGVRVCGLMTMAAFGADEGQLRSTFGQLRELRHRLTGLGYELPHLSMGMSDDFEIAVEEGATMVRLGSALFGPRPGVR